MIAAGQSGASMIILNIIWPVLAMVALIFAVWFTLVVKGLRHIRRIPPAADTFATGDAVLQYLAPLAMLLATLFEVAVLFFAPVRSKREYVIDLFRARCRSSDWEPPRRSLREAISRACS